MLGFRHFTLEDLEQAVGNEVRDQVIAYDGLDQAYTVNLLGATPQQALDAYNRVVVAANALNTRFNTRLDNSSFSIQFYTDDNDI